MAFPIIPAITAMGTLAAGAGSIYGAASGGLDVGEQKELMRYQSDLNSKNWYDQFTTINQYNDPSALVKRYRDAGISPAAAFGSGTSVGQSGASPQNFQGGFPSPTYTRPNAVQMISSIAQALKDVGSAGLSFTQSNEINQKLFGELRKLDDEHEWQALTNGILSAYGSKKASAEIDSLMADVQKAASITELNSEQVKTEADKRLNMACDRAIKGLEKDLKGKDLEKAKMDVEYYRKFKLAELNNIYSLTNKNVAESEKASSESRLLNATSEGKELENNIKRATNLTDIENAIFDSDVITFLKQSSDKEALYQELERYIKVSSAYKNSDDKIKVDAVLENLRKILGISINAGASASN